MVEKLYWTYINVRLATQRTHLREPLGPSAHRVINHVYGTGEMASYDFHSPK